MNQSIAVIFDIDGVLVDSYEAHFQSWRSLACEAGITLTKTQFAQTFGRTGRDIIACFWGDLPDDDIKRMDERKEAFYRDIVSDNFPAMPGAADLIGALRDAGCRIAVGSSGPPENVQLVIDRLALEGLLGAVVHGMDVTRGKPDPQVFLLAAQRLGIEPRHCVVVEDAPAGIAAAHAAGMSCVALCSTGRTCDELAEADLIVDALTDLQPAHFIRLLADRTRRSSVPDSSGAR
ncbi:MAG: HAD family phosphatase [Phycisphaerales bacterium]|nr:HAD family phosphatase [Phycisphaerales bacterium]